MTFSTLLTRLRGKPLTIGDEAEWYLQDIDHIEYALNDLLIAANERSFDTASYIWNEFNDYEKDVAFFMLVERCKDGAF